MNAKIIDKNSQISVEQEMDDEEIELECVDEVEGTISDDCLSDGEPKEGEPPNWRILSIFNDDEGLGPDGWAFPCDCERPQSDEGRTFPHVEKKVYINRNLEDDDEDDGDHLDYGNPTNNDGEADVLRAGAAGQPKRPFILAERKMATQVRAIGNNLPNNQVPHNFTSSTSTHSLSHQFAPTSGPQKGQKTALFQTQKRFPNKSLTLIAGKRFYSDSNECFQFAHDHVCPSGIFCAFTHGGKYDHQRVRVCYRFFNNFLNLSFYDITNFSLLQGKCRFGERCRDGPHAPLLPHQMPVCHYFLKMSCGNANCSYLHVKHSVGG
jgi:hypothetical protein